MRPRLSECCTLLSHVLPALVAAPLLVLVTGAPASACSCVEQSLQESLHAADAVFAGEVLRRDAPSDWNSSAEKATYVVRVDRVFKGEASDVQEVVTVVSGATCGLELPSSGPALLFARRDGVEFLDLEPERGQLTATLCGGSRVGEQVPADFGSGYPPATSKIAAAPTAGANGTGSAGAMGLASALGLAGALGVAGAVSLVGVRARRRQHDSDG